MAHILEKFKFNNKPAYTTDMGAAYCEDSLNLLPQLPDGSLEGVFKLSRKKLRSVL
ncbi:MAG: hypothetical protein LBH78_04285 [Rickettsiales bacterium]|jgi:hypothetical protein|nr:hypothetical protein [Rickettsiales bacterium]